MAVENIIPDSPKIVQMLLNDSNIDVNAYDNIFSLFFFLIILNLKFLNTEFIENCFNNLPLLEAIKNKSIEIVNLLLSHPKIDIKKVHNQTKI